MIHYFFIFEKLIPIIDARNEDLDLLKSVETVCEGIVHKEKITLDLNPQERFKVLDLKSKLEPLNNMTKVLQEDKLTLEDVRYYFDAAIEKYPGLNTKISSTASIICQKDFENGLFKLQSGDSESLTLNEQYAVSKFKIQLPTELEKETTNTFDPELWFKDVLKTIKTKASKGWELNVSLYKVVATYK